MSPLEQQYVEDRQMRDAALVVLKADIDHLKASFSGKSMASTVGGRISEGAKDVLEVAKAQAQDNRGVVAALLGAILLYLARVPILDFLGMSKGDEHEADEAKDQHPDPGDGDQDGRAEP